MPSLIKNSNDTIFNMKQGTLTIFIHVPHEPFIEARGSNAGIIIVLIQSKEIGLLGPDIAHFRYWYTTFKLAITNVPRKYIMLKYYYMDRLEEIPLMER